MCDDVFEELRVIASDADSLSAADREVLRAAADEYDDTVRKLVWVNAKFIESQQIRIALNERLIDLTRAQGC